MRIAWWPSRVAALVALCLIAACATEERPTGFFADNCAEIESLDDQGPDEFAPTAEELAAMSDAERQMWLGMAEDWPRFGSLMRAICELSRAKAFPGIGSLEGAHNFWAARVRRDELDYVTNGLGPAAVERRCARLWFMVLTREGHDEARFSFCDTADGFVLISGYERRGASRVKLE